MEKISFVPQEIKLSESLPKQGIIFDRAMLPDKGGQPDIVKQMGEYDEAYVRVNSLTVKK